MPVFYASGLNAASTRATVLRELSAASRFFGSVARAKLKIKQLFSKSLRLGSIDGPVECRRRGFVVKEGKRPVLR